MTITFYEVEDKISKIKSNQGNLDQVENTNFYEKNGSNTGVDWHSIRIMRRAAERWGIL
ncbi:hypothetical protein GF312_09755 [Candidatus Poribacteria bacterium]|nr:hypothetical protein [Candidatus Poribacteria bacterium]